MENRTIYEFPCPYTIEERYELICTGEYGVFEMFGRDGEINGYRGYRKGYGTTGVYDTYKGALEASFTEFGPKKGTDNVTTVSGQQK